MFVGHYGVSFSAQRVEQSIPLWALFLAVQVLDVLWAPFILLGIEKVRLVIGLAVFSHWVLDFIVHRPDLPLYGNSAKVGLGLWNAPRWLSAWRPPCSSAGCGSTSEGLGPARSGRWYSES